MDVIDRAPWMFTELVIPLTIFIAGIIRGYTGFGFAAITVLILAVHYPVKSVVPAVLVADLLIGLPLVSTSWKQCDFKLLMPIFIATLIGVPIGIVILRYVSEPSLKLLVPTVILTLAAIPYIKNRYATMLLSSSWVCGVMSGWTTSAVSAGGAPVIIHLRYSKLNIELQRDTLIVYFFLTTNLTVGLGYTVNHRLHFFPEQPYLWLVLAVSGALIGKVLFAHFKLPIIHHLSYYLLISLSFWALIKAIINF